MRVVKILGLNSFLITEFLNSLPFVFLLFINQRQVSKDIRNKSAATDNTAITSFRFLARKPLDFDLFLAEGKKVKS
jgi:hypothetical protein